MKICSKCGLEKDDSEFYQTSGKRCKVCHNKNCVERGRRNPEANRQRSKKWYYASEENRQRSINNARQWQSENRERDRLLQYKNSLLRNYKLSYEVYLEMEAKQDGKCFICKQSPKRRLDVDHDHSCCASAPTCGNCTRGLLCSNCNTALGLFKESKELFSNALSYLKQYNLQQSE